MVFSPERDRRVRAMDRTYIEAHHVIDRYLMGQLSADEKNAFEQAYLDDPELLDQLQRAQAMHAELKKAELQLSGKMGPSRSAARWMYRPAFALSALMLFGASLVLSGFLYSELRSQRSVSIVPIAVGNEVWLEQTRGQTDHLKTVPVNGPVILRIDIGPNDARSYSVDIGRQSGEVQTFTGLTADSENSLRLLVRDMEEGQYSITVWASSENADTVNVGEFRFRAATN